MTFQEIGPISILTGKNGSRVPYSTSLLIKGKNEEAALIDCGAGQNVFDEVERNHSINTIFLTHYHLDHIWGAHLFDQASIYINPCDLNKLSDPYELAKASGIAAFQDNAGIEKWIQKQIVAKKPAERDKPSWQTVIGVVDHVYSYDELIDVCGTKMKMIHSPGHTEGYCCPYFPEYGMLFVGDFDLTSFGPWYNDADSDIDQFIKSAKRTLETDAKYFVTAHHKGSFERHDYEKRLVKYIDKVYEREEKIKLAIQQGVTPKDIVFKGVFYYIENHQKNRYLMASEIIGIAKHIKRLIKQGYHFKDYFQDFVTYYGIQPDALDYSSEPVAPGIARTLE